MIRKTKITSDQAFKLEVIIEGVLSFLRLSKDSIYADYTVLECQKSLRKTLNRTATGKRIRLSTLQFMFSPASSLQDISLANNWSDEYLELAKQFDLLSLKA